MLGSVCILIYLSLSTGDTIINFHPPCRHTAFVAPRRHTASVVILVPPHPPSLWIPPSPTSQTSLLERHPQSCVAPQSSTLSCTETSLWWEWWGSIWSPRWTISNGDKSHFQHHAELRVLYGNGLPLHCLSGNGLHIHPHTETWRYCITGNELSLWVCYVQGRLSSGGWKKHKSC